MTDPLPVLLQLTEQYRKRVLKREAQAIAPMVRSYGAAYKRLAALLDSLLLKLRDEPRDNWRLVDLNREERYRELMAQIEAELRRFGPMADDLIVQLAEDSAATGFKAGAQLMRAAGLRGTFNLLPVGAAETLAGMLQPGTPLADYLTANVLPGMQQRVTDALLDGLIRGKNPRVIGESLRQQFGKGLTAAVRTARTTNLWAYREANRAQWAANEDVVTGWQWHAFLGPRTCISCLNMHGTIHPLSEPLNDHWNGRCHVSGTLVSGPAVHAFVSRRYEGDVVSIRTASGKFLTVTPNHPILTDRGWIAAKFIQEGVNVVRHLNFDWAATGVSPDKYQAPTLIEDIPRALGMNRLASVPATAENFHGDGAGSDVYVVWANRLLGDSLDPERSQRLGQNALRFGELRALLARGGHLATLLEGVFAAARGFLSDCDAAMMLLNWRLCCEQPIGLGAVPSQYARFTQPDRYCTTGDIERARESILRFSGDIAAGDFVGGQQTLGQVSSGDMASLQGQSLLWTTEQPVGLERIRQSLGSDMEQRTGSLYAAAGDIGFDSVVEVGVRRFSGHVYNLQTQAGWYNSNGIIAHNCAAIPITLDTRLDAERMRNAGRKWLEAQPEKTQRAHFTDGALYDAWKSKQVSWDELTTEKADDVFGKMRQAPSLKELRKAA